MYASNEKFNEYMMEPSEMVDDPKMAFEGTSVKGCS